MMRLLILSVLLLQLSGCAGKTTFNDFRVSVGLVSAYSAAESEFKKGQVMKARKHLLSIKKDHKDYAKGQDFLKKEVEPARLKLLSYYAKKGKKEQRLGHWAKAEEAYATAVALSTKPDALKKYQAAMNIKVRQLRVNAIYKQRKIEDKAWLSWLQGYVPPKGLLGDDKAFMLVRSDLKKAFESRIDDTWDLAQTFKDIDMPEMAWLYADAYLRLSPGEKKAQDLKNAMATAVPKGFVLPKEKKAAEKTKTTKAVKQDVTEASVKALMKQGKWQAARQQVLTLRKHGDPKADVLLDEIDTRIKLLAEKAYQDGNLAFRSEKISEAVKFWQRAVDLRPDEQTYVDSLRRGKQIQERLGALKTETEE